MVLSDEAVEQIKPSERGCRREIVDSLCKGFMLRVTDSGAKSFNVVYSFHGRRRRMTIGQFPEIGVDEAREKAREARKLLRSGIDPDSTSELRRPILIEAITDRFIEEMTLSRRADSYVEETRRVLDRHVLTRWRGRNVRAIVRSDVVSLLRKVADGAGDARRPIAANRLWSTLRMMFRRCVARGEIFQSPADGVARPSLERPRRRELSRRDIAIIGKASKRLDFPKREFVQILLLTGSGRTKVARMRWEELDLGAATWTPAGGLEEKLPSEAVALLSEMPRRRPHVFPGVGGAPIGGFSQLKRLLDEHVAALCVAEGIEQLAPFRLDDLRRAKRDGLGRDSKEDKKRLDADRWGARVTRLIAG